MIMKGDRAQTWERASEVRRESSRIDFVISEDDSEWSMRKTRKLLSNHWAIHAV